ncbi:SlyX family protein [Rhodoferax sp. GW822-FHT02A01]|jgi:SlyX protein|uniref:SlyX family protein n=1 Tax=Rhodoferax sp. GW822-FHT02A01 TaxID=3141537 RepID=UPI00315C884A
MTHTNDIERRLEALEIKASFAEDVIDKLDQIIIRQQQTIDALVAQVRDLRELSASTAEGGQARTLRDELPPHY